MSELTSHGLAGLAVLFIGLSKAGFGGGLGMLTTPLCALVFDPREAVGIVLPLLCAGDAFSMYHYWGKWEKANLKYLIPGVGGGVLIGVHLVGRFSSHQFNIAIGAIAVGFVLFQWTKEIIFRAEGAFAPNHKIGIPCGIGTGITSTFAHGAGPVVSMFLIPQQLPKEIYVGTSVLVFTFVNWIKMPFFCIDQGMVPLPFFATQSIITHATLWKSAVYFPLVPLGVWLGVWLNRKFSERTFLQFVYVATLLTGIQLICNFKFGTWGR